ncbi:MAG: aldo/keto reductase [Proteobacteria bacterium]|nr:aldo/keto reductase [Pseudomonadota bacterium]
MRNVKLGELSVSALGLGCMSMSQAYGPPDAQESERTLHRALDIGVTFLDTANAYGVGHNEELIGRVLSSRRDEFVLATKFGIVKHPDGKRGIDGRPEFVAERCEESLRRLNTDVIDLYYLHRLDPNVPIEETVGAMGRLVEAGKVRHLGLSEISSKTLRKAHAVHPITAVQSEYSLWTRDPESHVLPTCRELGIGFVPFSPLGRAMLTGAITNDDSLSKDDLRANMPRFMGENFTRNYAVVQKFLKFAERKGASGAQISLAWLLAQGDGIAPIPGTKHVNFLEEDMAGVDVELNDKDLKFLDELFAIDNIVGHRYPAALQQSIDSD